MSTIVDIGPVARTPRVPPTARPARVERRNSPEIEPTAAYAAAVGIARGPEVQLALQRQEVYARELAFYRRLQHDRRIELTGEKTLWGAPRKLLLAALIQKMLEEAEETKPGSRDDLDDELRLGNLSLHTNRLKRVAQRVENAAEALVAHLGSGAFLREFNNLLPAGRPTTVRYSAEEQLQLATVLVAGLERTTLGQDYLLRSVSAEPFGQADGPPPMHPIRIDEWRDGALRGKLPDTVEDIDAYHVDPATSVVKSDMLGLVKESTEHTLKVYLTFSSDVVTLLATAAEKKMITSVALANAVHTVMQAIYPESVWKGVNRDSPEAVLEAFGKRFKDSPDTWLKAVPHIASGVLLTFTVLKVNDAVEKFRRPGSDPQDFIELMKEATGALAGFAAIGEKVLERRLVDKTVKTVAVKSLEGIVAGLNLLDSYLGTIAGAFSVADAIENGDVDEVIGPAFVVAGALAGMMHACYGILILGGATTAAAMATPLAVLGVAVLLLGLGAAGAVWAFSPSTEELLLRHSYFTNRKRIENSTDPADAHFQFRNFNAGALDRQISAFLQQMQLFGLVVEERRDQSPLAGVLMKLEFAIPIEPHARVELVRYDGDGRETSLRTFALEGQERWSDARQQRPFDIGADADRVQTREIWRPLSEQRPVEELADPTTPAGRFDAAFNECIAKAALPPEERRLKTLEIFVGLDDDDHFDHFFEARVTLEQQGPLQRHLVQRFTDIPFETLEINLPLELYLRGKAQ